MRSNQKCRQCQSNGRNQMAIHVQCDFISGKVKEVKKLVVIKRIHLMLFTGTIYKLTVNTVKESRSFLKRAYNTIII